MRLTTTLVELPQPDVFAAYQRLRTCHRADDLFLLESLAGDDQDRKSATVGIGPVLGLAIRGDRVRTFGGAPAVTALQNCLGDLLEGSPGEEQTLRIGVTAWDLLRGWLRAFTSDAGDDQPAFIVVLGYDAAGHIERLPRRIAADRPHVEVSVQLFQAVLETDLVSGTAQLAVHNSDYWPAVDAVDLAEWLTTSQAVAEAAAPSPPPPVPAPEHVLDESTTDSFQRRVGRALDHIGCGDIYQVQLGHEVRIRSTADPWTVYQRLRTRNPSPYMFIVPVLDGSLLLGASPEAFVRLTAGRIMMRPVAGTLPRGQVGSDGEGAAARRLRDDPKEAAEHRMLVDLCRNDIGRVCAGGSLVVSVDREVTRYSHVLHLVSTVEGNLAAEHDAVDLLTATFPAGTMTGAPKIRAMEIIEDLETSRRGLYAGAVGILRRDGDLNTALCIRAAVARDGEYRIRASAGVVADSLPEREWAETIAKLGATYWAVTGEELS